MQLSLKKKEGNMKKALYGLALSFLSALFGYLIGEICGSLNAFNNNKSVGEESFDTHLQIIQITLKVAIIITLFQL